MDGAGHILQNKFSEKRAEKGTALMIPILLGPVALTLGIKLYFCMVQAVLHNPPPLRPRHLPKFWALSPFVSEWACSQNPQLTPSLHQEGLQQVLLSGAISVPPRGAAPVPTGVPGEDLSSSGDRPRKTRGQWADAL